VSIQNYSRAERKGQVIQQMILKMRRGGGAEWTMYKMARSLGLKPSTHFQNILNEMVSEGKLIKRQLIGRPDKWNTYYYAIHPDFLALDFAPKRTINVRANGKQAGQLELF